MSGLADELILGADRFLRTLTAQPVANRQSPADGEESPVLSEEERKHAAGLMRINHTGEVCAQALYEGQAAAARENQVRDALLKAASEEEDHLAWCSDRLSQLESEPSKLNPAFYVASYLMGIVTGAMGDKISLGFVAATEEQVCKHLEHHMKELPTADTGSLKVIQQMHADEQRHGTQALDAGGTNFPKPIKQIMTAMSKLMTSTTYRI
jgi:ubiquinone biosynthesis monooxygenase Coq7